MGKVRGPRPELKRVSLIGKSATELKHLMDGIEYRLLGVKDWDKYHKELYTILYNLRQGRNWLSVRQFRTAEVLRDLMFEQYAKADKFFKRAK